MVYLSVLDRRGNTVYNLISPGPFKNSGVWCGRNLSDILTVSVTCSTVVHCIKEAVIGDTNIEKLAIY